MREERPEQGLMQPLYPAPKDTVLWTPFPRCSCMTEQTCFRAKQKETDTVGAAIGRPSFFRKHCDHTTQINASTGVMKTRERRERKQVFSFAVSLFSPDAQHPVGGERRPPVGTVPHPIRNIVTLLQKHISARFRFSGTLFAELATHIRKMGAGAMPLLGRGVKPHKSFLKQKRLHPGRKQPSFCN